jgi:threonine aldolase
MNFISDNSWGAWPEMIDAIALASSGQAASYGDDEITKRLTLKFSRLFEHDVEVFPVVTGTAANALALATLVPPHGATFCYANSHIAVDECGAPEFFSQGAKLVGLRGSHAKIAPAEIEQALAHLQRGFVHNVQPAAISITQATELGTLYTLDEIRALSELARKQDLKLHMDGARFANALAALGCSPADATWRSGVDALSFGATKGGALAAEAVIFFNRNDEADFPFRRKRSGHLLSKLRFVSAQLEAYVEGGRWLVHARNANDRAQALVNGLSAIAGIEIAHPVEANSVFARVPDATAAKLRSHGAVFYDWEPSSDGRTLIRLVTSFATPDSDVERFLAIAKS